MRRETQEHLLWNWDETQSSLSPWTAGFRDRNDILTESTVLSFQGGDKEAGARQDRQQVLGAAARAGQGAKVRRVRVRVVLGAQSPSAQGSPQAMAPHTPSSLTLSS